MLKQKAFWVSAVPMLAALAWAAPASAISLADCGNINVEGNAECTVEVEGGCEAMCTPLACSASLYVECSGSCQLSATAECTAACDIEGCLTDCQGGNFDCSASCQGDCGATCAGSCDAECAADGNSAECQGRCESSCTATCQGECDAQCDIELPDCDTKCNASCEGSCTAQANASCQSSCQSEGYAQCTGGCEVECQKPDGAVFCDGQWIDHGGHFANCVASIQEHIDAEFQASSSASCANGSCQAEAQAEAKASTNCSVQNGAPASGSSDWALGVAAGLVLWSRRRRGSR